jgi:hypothetical protein
MRKEMEGFSLDRINSPGIGHRSEAVTAPAKTGQYSPIAVTSRPVVYENLGLRP